MGRYGSYFFSVLLGTAYTAVKPIGGLLRKPVTAVFTLAALAALAVFVTSTVRAMLGVGAEFEVRWRTAVPDELSACRGCLALRACRGVHAGLLQCRGGWQELFDGKEGHAWKYDVSLTIL